MEATAAEPAAFGRRSTIASPETGRCIWDAAEEHVELHKYRRKVNHRWVGWARCKVGTIGDTRLSSVLVAALGFLWYLLASFTP